MPEYLAPGVYVEETSFRPKTIEGVSTSTAGFVGPARFGPTEGEPELLTSFADFERIYGGLDPLAFEGGEQPNFLAHGVRAFFEEGGRRCYVGRVYDGGGGAPDAQGDIGHASNAAASPPDGVAIRARFPGAGGNFRLTFLPVLGENVLVSDPLSSDPANPDPLLRGVRVGDTVFVTSADSAPDSGYYTVVATDTDALQLEDDAGVTTPLSDLALGTDEVHLLTVNVQIERPVIRPTRPGQRFDDSPEVLEGFALHPDAPRSLTSYFTAAPPSRRLALTVPFTIDLANAASPPDATGTDFALALFGNDPTVTPAPILLEGGIDGARPGAGDYRGNSTATRKSGFAALEEIEDISIVAAPGYSFGYNAADSTGQLDIEQVQAHLVNHATRMRYRIAVLDAPDGSGVSDVRAYRGRIDSRYAALYYPWVTIFDPITEEELDLPPSGFVSGIYARNDVERGVQKAPANEVVRSAVAFEFAINTAQQEVLNPEGINCFRFFEGRGNRLWGARTATSDGEWRYVNLRRYFAYLERSIDQGTQTFVFESNGERLWANVRRTIEDFLFNEWKSGRTMGLTPEEAFFVRCDRTTMTQNDIDNGRLICLIGVAPLRPAEFVIFRIGQKLIETRAA